VITSIIIVIIIMILIIVASWVSVFGSATKYGLEGAGFDFRQKQEIFLSSKMSRPAVRPNRLLVKWVPGLILVSKATGGVTLPIHLSLVPRLRISGATLLSPLYAFMARTWTIPLKIHCLLH
jgi:hypothetical protein